MKEPTIRYVNCTKEFVDKLFAHVGASDSDETPLGAVTSFIERENVWRFVVQLGALLPLAVCVAVSLNKRVDNACLRLFCWNCAFVNAVFAVFLGYRFVALQHVYVLKSECFYIGTEPSMDIIKDDGTLASRVFLKNFLYDVLNKWSAYSISLSLVCMRCANYCACVSPLRFTDVLSMRNLWLALTVVGNIVSLPIASVDELKYLDVEIDVRVQALIVAVFAVGIWIFELVVSLLTVVQVFKYVYHRKSVTKEQSRDVTKMVTFLLFSISPALQPLPFVYTDVKDTWHEWKSSAFMECIDKLGDLSKLPEEEQVEAIQNCEGNVPDF